MYFRRCSYVQVWFSRSRTSVYHRVVRYVPIAEPKRRSFAVETLQRLQPFRHMRLLYVIPYNVDCALTDENDNVRTFGLSFRS